MRDKELFKLTRYLQSLLKTADVRIVNADTFHLKTCLARISNKENLDVNNLNNFS